MMREPLTHLPACVRVVSLAGLSACLMVVTASEVRGQRPRTVTSPKPLRVEEALGVRRFADRQQVDLSSDGALVAYTVIDPRRAALLAQTDKSSDFTSAASPTDVRGAELLITDVLSGATRSLGRGRGNSWSPVWSPDGQRLAFYSDRDGAARLWLWDRRTDALRRLTDAVVFTNFGFESARWSPDGRRILVKLLPAGLTIDQARRLAGERSLGASTVAARRPGLVTARIYSTERDTAPTGSRATVNVDSAPSFFNASLSDLALIDVANGRVVRVARRVRVMGHHFSPDSRQIAFSTRQPYRPDGSMSWGLYDLWAVDTAGRGQRLLVPRAQQEYGLNFSWSPDGRQLAYVHDGALETRQLQGDTTPRRIARPGIRFTHGYRRPLWLDASTLLFLEADTLWRIDLAAGSAVPVGAVPSRQIVEIVTPADAASLAGGRDGSVLVATRDPATMRMGFFRVDLRTGGSRALYEEDVALGATDLAYNLDVAMREGSIIFVAETSASPPDIWASEADLARPRRLTTLHPGVTAHALGRSRLVSWTTASGDTLRGALLLPADYMEGRRYPLVVKVYGGSRLSRTVNRFGLQSGVDNLQLFATRGYAVLLPDTPLREGTPMADLAATVMPGIDAVIALGIADPERLAVFGHSYGGYCALALLVQTTRFKAGASSAGFGNLLTQYAEMRDDGTTVGTTWSERGQGRMGGTPWEVRERYVANSPFFFLDRVTAPVLLLHGGADQTVLPERAKETFVALRRLGKRAELVIYDGEEHHPGTWGLSNAADYYDRVFEWFDRYLKSGVGSPPR